METPTPRPSLGQSLAKIIAERDFGDERLTRRVLKMAEDCLQSSKCSVAAMFGSAGTKDTKAANNLLSNARLDIGEMREALYDWTFLAIQERKIADVVCLYDPTLLDFSKQNWKQGRIQIGDGNGRGYEWLNCVLVDGKGGHVLGIGHQTLVSEKGPDDGLDYAPGIPKKRDQKKMKFNPANQFVTIALAVDERIPEGMTVTHAADREFDDGLVLRSRLQSKSSHFVIRGNDTRIVQVRDEDWLPREALRPKFERELRPVETGVVNVGLKDLVRHLPCPFSRELALDARGRACKDGDKVAHVAQLEVGATPIRLARQSKRGEKMGISEEAVWLNLVVVREKDPRPEKPRILWLLLTDLPVATEEEIFRVVDAYAARWRIEEFFRTVKDAMKLEMSELDDPVSTGRLLFFATLKAIFLDELRLTAEIAAGSPPSKEERKELVKGADAAIAVEKARQEGVPVPKLDRRTRARMALGLIARRGCWVAKNGVSLGNYVLLRGLPIVLHDVSEGRYAWLFEGDE